MKELWKKFRCFGGDRTGKGLLWIGILGLVLIGLTEIVPMGKSQRSDGVTVTESQVEEALEQRIANLLSAVEGVGKCRVMVTLESGARSVYAADTSVTASGTSEQVLTVDTDAGPVGLLLTHIQPSVKGVAIVCDGAGNPTVHQRVIDLVSTAFHISERRVCVVQQK